MSKKQGLNKTYLNISFSPINMKYCNFDHTSSIYKAWSCQPSDVTISKVCRSTVDAQCGM